LGGDLIFLLFADNAALSLIHRDTITSGASDAFPVQFQFSEAWDGLTKIAVFRAGDRSVSLLLDESNSCFVPWEVLSTPNHRLFTGVYGTNGQSIILPTVWADCGAILQGAAPGETARPPSPGPFEQILSKLSEKQDKLSGLPGQFVGFDAHGRAVPQSTPAPSAASDEEVDRLLDDVFGTLP